jgi:hypothetical protein
MKKVTIVAQVEKIQPLSSTHAMSEDEGLMSLHSVS